MSRESSPETSPAKTTTSSDSDSERETSPDSSGSSVDSGDSPLNIWGESSDDDHDDGDDDLQDFDDHAALAPLGTVNGIYKIKCEYMKFMHGFSSKDLGLALRPVGSSLWAKFGLGFYEGVMYFEECPRESSGDQVWFKWRGRVEGGPIYYGGEHRGWIKFLGGGRISGWMEQFTFEGWHDPNQPPTTRRELQEFRREWNSYTKARYDKEYRDYFSRFP
ncbi:hypothetical protein FALBO_6560 [Fusarium albosuccineum]|uniref:Uncharacterized protein n=1 Tax=Fusarium albosuccineum TaxID=1237068 RepID=A0A8H4LDZ8_9HYPO|nr:hypothetical protein FALBO_6560 [Fusarium albosuccineum]